MTLEERLDQLERRVAILEGSARPVGHVAPPVEPAPLAAPTRARVSARRFGTEQWIGQRGILAVGVALLVLAAAYLLKLAIDRGWISPAVRCIGAAIAGMAISAVGWRLYARGLKTYGASLIGAGAAIIYLGVWAAARLFSLVSPTIGITGLAVVSLALVVIAYRLGVQPLAAAGAIGALFAPIVAGPDSPNATGLVIYLGVMGLSLGAVAVMKRWRATTDLVALAYFWLAIIVTQRSAPGVVFAYALAGGSAGLALRGRWNELGFVAFFGAWTLFSSTTQRLHAPWLSLAGAIVLAIPIWQRALNMAVVWPDPAVAGSRLRWLAGESVYFYMTPVFFMGALGAAFPRLHAISGAIPLVVALPYLIAGLTKVRVPFAVVGTFALTVAALSALSGLGVVYGVLGISAAWAGLDHILRRTDGRWYSLPTLTLALLILILEEAGKRGTGAAFADRWALTVWITIAVVVAMAMGLWLVTTPEPGAQAKAGGQPARWASLSAQEGFLALGSILSRWIPAALWTLAGALLFGGVTGELWRLVHQQDFAPDVAQLAGGLSVSAWWTVFAGGLVFFGFRRRLKQVRIAGLAVAGIALAKVLLFDLSRLDALYRVGSVFILAVVSLLIAYLYNQRARSDATGGVNPQAH